MSRIGVVDFGRGNLASVLNACISVGGQAQILHEPGEVAAVSHIILPGVGAFGEGMKLLQSNGWDAALHEHAIEKRRPFLGICLGMQLLAETGTEHGNHAGLGWIAGRVTKLAARTDERIPHMGWNSVELAIQSRLFDRLPNHSHFYFVHSYAVQPLDQTCVTSWCDHGHRFAASLQVDNIFATQFHPEKSQRAGLRLLENFLAC